MIEIISIGDELLNGSTLNTNAKVLANDLYEIGYVVTKMTTLSDNEDELKAGIEKALRRSKLVITTGGLGPTLDDKTEEIVTSILPGEPQKLENGVGSAYGLFYKENGLVVLPGVPREMKAMWQNIKKDATQKLESVQKLHHRKITFCLLPELAVDPTLRELQKAFPSIYFGIYPSFGTLIVRLSTREDPKILDEPVATLTEKFPTDIMAYEACSAEESLHKLFIEKKKTFAVAESCTGGSISSRLTAIPNSSEYFLGGVVSYSNDAKMNLLGVSNETLQAHGAVSQETALEMLAGVFERFQSDYALAVTGIAGPSGALQNKPVGTVWMAIGENGKKPFVGLVPRLRARVGREGIIQMSGTFGLASLWRLIQHGLSPFEDENG